jgi:drug/metabolite transporter (DMT)-like permease
MWFYLASMALFGSIGAVVRLLALPSSEIALFRGLYGSICLVPFLLGSGRTRLAPKLKRNWLVLLLFGLVLVSSGQQGGSGTSHPLAGAAFGFAAALCYASLIVLNKFVVGMDGLETTLPQLSLATLILAIYVMASGTYRPFPPLGWQAGLLLLLGVVHTGAGFLMFFLGIKGLKAQTIALLSYMDPMVSVAISLLVFGEVLAPQQTLGACCIGGSILFATLTPAGPGRQFTE